MSIQSKGVLWVVCLLVLNMMVPSAIIVSGIRISREKSKDDIIFIKSCQLSRVSRYGKGMAVTYFDHNNEWRLEIIDRISSCELIFVSTMKRNVPIYRQPELMVYLNMMGFGGLPLVLGLAVDTYVKYDQF